LTEIREALLAAPDGPPLALVAPKQATYQLERQLLGDSSLSGYTRLHIFSFERLAHFALERLCFQSPEMLGEQGRLMVLRAIVAKPESLKLFRASARLNGFARQLSLVLRELQRAQLTPESLLALSEQAADVPGLTYKLQDLATLLREYLDWLATHRLQDADSLLSAATTALRESPKSKSKVQSRKKGWMTKDGVPTSTLSVFGWVRGTPDQKLNYWLRWRHIADGRPLPLPGPNAGENFLALDWSVVRRTFEECRKYELLREIEATPVWRQSGAPGRMLG
jgi:hypothetical protein